MNTSASTVEQLQRQIHRMERSGPEDGEEVVSSGCQALDRWLPADGIRRGTLIECLGAGPGGGAGALALQFARQACQQGGALVVVDRHRQIYPPALAAWGFDLSRVVLVYPQSLRELTWVWDQSLRCPGVAVTWGPIERMDDRLFRRLQLSAESCHGLGILVRPAPAKTEPSWADLRLWIEPQAGSQGRWVEVELLHCRGGRSGGKILLAWDEWTGELRVQNRRKPDETHARTLAAQLARATPDRRAPRTGCSRSRAV